LTKNGILCQNGQTQVHLDPKRISSKGINFVSHAHADHLPSNTNGTILSSNETNEIANLRGVKMENFVNSMNDFELVNSGHILGSKGLLFDEVFYTGDICTRDRGFLKGVATPRESDPFRSPPFFINLKSFSFPC